MNIYIHVVNPHLNRLSETVLMRGHNLRFYGEIWKIIPKISLLPLLIWSSELDLSNQCRPRSDCSSEVVLKIETEEPYLEL